jgi:hypothetical protein
MWAGPQVGDTPNPTRDTKPHARSGQVGHWASVARPPQADTRTDRVKADAGAGTDPPPLKRMDSGDPRPVTPGSSVSSAGHAPGGVGHIRSVDASPATSQSNTREEAQGWVPHCRVGISWRAGSTAVAAEHTVEDRRGTGQGNGKVKHGRAFTKTDGRFSGRVGRTPVVTHRKQTGPPPRSLLPAPCSSEPCWCLQQQHAATKPPPPFPGPGHGKRGGWVRRVERVCTKSANFQPLSVAETMRRGTWHPSPVAVARLAPTPLLHVHGTSLSSHTEHSGRAAPHHPLAARLAHHPRRVAVVASLVAACLLWLLAPRDPGGPISPAAIPHRAGARNTSGV